MWMGGVVADYPSVIQRITTGCVCQPVIYQWVCLDPEVDGNNIVAAYCNIFDASGSLIDRPEDEAVRVWMIGAADDDAPLSYDSEDEALTALHAEGPPWCDLLDTLTPLAFLETEASFFGRKRVNPAMKDAKMETDCGGMLITKAPLTYGEADQLAEVVDLAGFPAFCQTLVPSAYWRSPYETPKPTNVFFVGELWWAIYSYLATARLIPGDPHAYHNGMEYLYDLILRRLVAAGVYTPDVNWRWFRVAADRYWTGPHNADWANDDRTTLRAPVSPERWPYGRPEKHQPVCLLHSGGLFCDCAASDASDTEWGEGW